ncbi:MAG: putative zinc-binding metallopeptidase [Candidatus Competibacteraceae bacterium]
MKNFLCDYCGQPIFFENVQCLSCGHRLGYLPDAATMSALEPVDEIQWRTLAPEANGRLYHLCQNYSQAQVCNWLVPAENAEPFCRSCRLNQTIPDLSQAENLAYWYRLEVAKRRLVYSLLSLGLPVYNKTDDPERGLAFQFLADPDDSFQENKKILTGHAGGVITLNVAEADDAVREKMRLDMHERYRTVLGHFRHEIGHYYWEQLVRDKADLLEACRKLFGDEREDYDQVLQRHYTEGPPADWQTRFISAYASTHPWEDWAETWAHYLHIVDTLETAEAFGLMFHPECAQAPELVRSWNQQTGTFDDLIERWVALTFAINSINRSMGLKDLYPFILSTPAIDKLRFVNHVIGQAITLDLPIAPPDATVQGMKATVPA